MNGIVTFTELVEIFMFGFGIGFISCLIIGVLVARHG